MKFKKCSILIITLCLLCLPKSVFAEDIATGAISCPPENINVSVCDSGECEVSDLSEFLRFLNNLDSSCYINRVNINIKNGYYIVDYNRIRSINNLTIKGEDKNKTTLVFDEVLEIYGMRNVTISDLKLKSFNGYGVLGIYDTRNVYLKNLIVDAKDNRFGIGLSYNDNIKIDNTVVNDASVFGIVNNACSRRIYPESVERSSPGYIKNLLSISNSDISSNDCGVFDGCYSVPRVGNPASEETSNSFNVPNRTEFRQLEPINGVDNNMIEYPYDTTIINKSKLSCVVAYGRMEGYYIPPSIYVESNNTWTEKPVYGDNVIESGIGRVVVDLEEEKSVTLKSKNQLELNSIFSDVSELKWTVEDETVAEVKDGKIVPLKVGKTVLNASNGSVNYRINLVVDNSLLSNPNTFNMSYVLVILIVGGLFGSMIYKRHYSK